ncbi:hypothetical protein DNU06_08620 [Putridiphycobacter roseus]|uniref:non-specific protein-tyrosine kinase n=1 Tax=Putridiphycobacter roseus TaxID=2219161 RepID=A0A2W1NDY9_9FLAO|nr:tyrosine-protein kinase [Putridiphycobacter roseus]PZE17323.1 hypothetical protein DNU06_08620 [Putridiphycobacter roseus]
MNNFHINNENAISSLNKDIDIDILKTVFKKNWIWLLLCVIIGVSIAFVYLRYTKPIYESRAIIQRSLKDEGQRILEFKDFNTENNLSADVELLRSPFLMEKVLMNLNLKISYFSEGEVLIEEKFKQSPYHLIFYELKDSSLINVPIYLKDGQDGLYLVFNANQKKNEIPVAHDQLVDNEYFKFVFKINNEKVFKADLEKDDLFFKINNYKTLTNVLIHSLIVNIENADANTIKVSFRSNNNVLAQDMVREVVETFFTYDLEKKSKSSESILSFIDEQLDTVYNSLKFSENSIQSFTNISKNNNPALYKENLLDQIDQLRTEVLQADLEYDLILGLVEGINSKNRVSIYNLIPTLAGTRFQPLLEGQIEKLYRLLEDQEDASYRMTMENDGLKNLESNIINQTETINRTLKAIKNQVKTRKDAVNKRVANLELKLYGVPQKEMQLAGLKRKFDLNEKYYSLLIEKRTQYQISKAGYTIDNNILQEASAPVLISPNPKMIYMAAFVLSLLIGIVYLGIKYITFNVINNEKELRKLIPSRVGFLGLVPKTKTTSNNSMLLVNHQPKSVLTENYRHIRSNLQFILDSEKSNVIAISSSISGEGKTFVSLNLAGIFTLANKKVMVLDLDMRKPKIHLGFNAKNEGGMSGILAGTLEWQNCIKNSELENLDFITAGNIPPNPSELILNGRLDTLLSELKQIYDIIIIDNPPIGIVSDGVNVMNNSDCPIYIVRANYTKRVLMQQLSKLIGDDTVRDLYVILNDVEMTKSQYGYGYGYGGYYSDEDSSKKNKKWFQIWK